MTGRSSLLKKPAPRIQGQSKPFVDQNMQIQVPDLEEEMSSFHENKDLKIAKEAFKKMREQLLKKKN